MNNNNFLLEMKNISKIFPGVKALDKVSFDLKKGEVHALVGENGAGKSTLMKILAGAYQQNEGSIHINGKKENIYSPHKAQELGISIIYQELNLIPNLTIAENLFLGREKVKNLGFIDNRKSKEEAMKLLDRLGAKINVNQRIEDINVSKMQIVEIAKALAINANIIIMDEPTASLGSSEVDQLENIINNLTENGVGVIFISHRLEEVKRFADRISILKDGVLEGTFDNEEISEDKIISLMVGRELINKKMTEASFMSEEVEERPVVLSVKNLSKKGVINNASFDLHKGEIMGITGLVGAGRTELVRLIMAVDEKDEGEIYINGNISNIKSPWQAVENGIGYVTEDRHDEGLILERSVRDNLSLIILEKLKSYGIINREYEKEIASDYVDKLDIKIAGLSQKVKNLSGGNQQKVIIAKWLLADSDIFIIDEPTRGIDVGAKEEIYKIINNLAEEGKSIIVISSELPEVLFLAHRILVMNNGSITKEFSGRNVTEEDIMKYAVSK